MCHFFLLKVMNKPSRKVLSQMTTSRISRKELLFLSKDREHSMNKPSVINCFLCFIIQQSTVIFKANFIYYYIFMCNPDMTSNRFLLHLLLAYLIMGGGGGSPVWIRFLHLLSAASSLTPTVFMSSSMQSTHCLLYDSYQCLFIAQGSNNFPPAINFFFLKHLIGI